ncbi:MAG: hypothetical protein L3K26_12285 [Candidatus Hydrogenedentes bacterium]|nr:hypothetical protein [Candidatus Hydrogenedentota bacterium]
MPEYTSRYDTHEVTNQPPLIEGYNAFETDPNLSEGIDRTGGEWALESLTAMGEHTGGHALIELGFLANENPPVLKTHDRFGNRIDQVKFHPAWHQLMAFGIQNGIHALPWCGEKNRSTVLCRFDRSGDGSHSAPDYHHINVVRDRDISGRFNDSVGVHSSSSQEESKQRRIAIKGKRLYNHVNKFLLNL